jgi:hypothetical protein
MLTRPYKVKDIFMVYNNDIKITKYLKQNKIIERKHNIRDSEYLLINQTRLELYTAVLNGSRSAQIYY